MTALSGGRLRTLPARPERTRQLPITYIGKTDSSKYYMTTSPISMEDLLSGEDYASDQLLEHFVRIGSQKARQIVELMRLGGFNAVDQLWLGVSDSRVEGTQENMRTRLPPLIRIGMRHYGRSTPSKVTAMDNTTTPRCGSRTPPVPARHQRQRSGARDQPRCGRMGVHPQSRGDSSGAFPAHAFLNSHTRNSKSCSTTSMKMAFVTTRRTVNVSTFSRMSPWPRMGLEI